jgi:dipeptidyl aminopeptidase/acylaminoacyl peptidase
MTLLASPAGPFGSLRISPDGTRLAYVGSRGDGPQPHDLFIQPLAGGPARNLTAQSVDRPVEDLSWEGPDALFILAAEGFGNAFYNLSLDGKAERADWAPALLAGSFSKGKAGLAFVGESAVEAPELWVAAVPDGGSRLAPPGGDRRPGKDRDRRLVLRRLHGRLGGDTDNLIQSLGLGSSHDRPGHGIREEKHRIDVINRVVDWFEKYLKK